MRAETTLEGKRASATFANATGWENRLQKVILVQLATIHRMHNCKRLHPLHSSLIVKNAVKANRNYV